MSRQVILEFPDDVPEEVLHDPELLNEGKTAIVLNMLRRGAISRDRAAELLEISPETLSTLIETYETARAEAEPQDPEDPTTATAGAWKDLLDCQAFEREVYESRRRPPGPEVRL